MPEHILREEVAKEFRHGFHIPADDKTKDTIIVKERVHFNDDTFEDRLVTYEDLKRPFYITKKIYRDHKQNKETEWLERLDKYECTDSELDKEILQKLGKRKFGKITRRDSRMSPYVYGADVTSMVLLKEAYRQKWKKVTPYTVTFFDIENDVETGEISVITGIRRNGEKIQVYTVINTATIPLVVDFESRVIDSLLGAMPDNTPDNFSKDQLEFEFVFNNNELDVIKTFFDRMHIWGSDFLTAWNIMYDIGTIHKAIINNGGDPEEIFTDPSLPKNIRKINFKEGRKVKKMKSGKESSIDPEKQWHLFASASKFYMIDAMASYYYIRVGGKEIQGGYSLENVLNKEVDFGKLKFKELTDLTNIEWHRFMLKNKPIEYIAYNIWDVLGMLFLEEKTNDLSLNLPLLSDRSMFDDFNRTSKRLTDDFHFAALEVGRVLGTQVYNENFEGRVGRNGWTVTLEPWKNVSQGYNIFEDIDLDSNIAVLTYDLDAVSAYPRATIATNLSKETTAREIISIGDIEPDEFRRANLNLLTGKIGHIDYCVNMFGLPESDILDRLINNKIRERRLR